jgi:primase-polymerase (primpol)-like protein
MLPQGNGRDNAQNARPNPHECFGENIPADVRAEPTWVLWHGEWKEDGKLHKEPYQISGYHASSTKSSTWTTFDKASEYATKRNDRYGIGYVFTPESEIGGMDLDGCVDSETLEIRPWAQEIIEAANTYVEYSPSLTGVKLIGRFKLPPMSGHQKILNEETREAIEVYDRGRFFTYTGRQVPGTPDDVRNMQVAVDGILARYFAKPQQTDSAPKTSRKLRELTEEEEQAAIEAIAGYLPEGHLNDLRCKSRATSCAGRTGRRSSAS